MVLDFPPGFAEPGRGVREPCAVGPACITKVGCNFLVRANTSPPEKKTAENCTGADISGKKTAKNDNNRKMENYKNPLSLCGVPPHTGTPRSIEICLSELNFFELEF